MKYKINYLTAGKPQVKDLKNINIFKKNTIAYELLDPINGFFFLESNALKNYYKYGDDEYPISKIVRHIKIFKLLDDKVTPSNDFIDMTSLEIGKFLGTQFYNFFILPVLKEYYTQEIEILNYIKSNISILVKYNPDTDKIKQFIEDSNKIASTYEKIDIQYDDKSNFLDVYKDFIINYLKGLNEVTSIQTTNVQPTNVQINIPRTFVLDTRKEIDAIMNIFNERQYLRKSGKMNLQKKVNNEWNNTIERYYDENKKYFKLVENTIKDILKKKQKEEGKLIIDYTLTSTLEDLDEIEKDNFIAQYTLEFFSIFLSIVWYKSSNKNPDIINYYKGLFSVLNPYQNFLDRIRREDVMGDIKEILNFNSTNQFTEYFNDTFKDFNSSKSDFQHSLAKKYIDSSPSVQLQEQNFSNLYMPNPSDFTKLIKCKTIKEVEAFPDCGEVSSRNFVKILCFNRVTDTYDTEKLRSYGASDDLIKYFETYDNENKINNEYYLADFEIIKKINGNSILIKSKLNSRDAWNIIVSGIPNVRYKNVCNNIGYEIISGKTVNNDKINMLEILNYLFPHRLPNTTTVSPTSSIPLPTTHPMMIPNITSFEDFSNDDIKLKYQIKNEELGLGNLIIKINKTKEVYIFYLENGHYWVDYDNNYKEEDESSDSSSDSSEEDEEQQVQVVVGVEEEKGGEDDERVEGVEEKEEKEGDEEKVGEEDEDYEASIESKLQSFNDCLEYRKNTTQCFRLKYSNKLLKVRKDNKLYFYLKFLKESFNEYTFDIDDSNYDEVINEILKIWKYNKFFYLYYSFSSIENLLLLIKNKIFTLILGPTKRNIYQKYIINILNFNNSDLTSRLNIDYNMIDKVDDIFKIKPYLDYESSINVKSILFNLTNENKFNSDVKNITLEALAKFKDEEFTDKINFLPDDLENLEILQNYNGLDSNMDFLEINSYVLPSKLKRLTYHSINDMMYLENVFTNLENLEELNLFGWYGENGLSSQLRLPASLKKIHFGDKFDLGNDIEFLKNTNVKEIIFGKKFGIQYFEDSKYKYEIPENIVLPITLENLTIHYGRSIVDLQDYNGYYGFGHLKHQIENIKKLTLIFDYDKKFETFDKKLKKLDRAVTTGGEHIVGPDMTFDITKEKRKFKKKYFEDYFSNIVGTEGLNCFMDNGLFYLEDINFISVKDGVIKSEIKFKLNTKIYTIDEIKSNIIAELQQTREQQTGNQQTGNQQTGNQLTDEDVQLLLEQKLDELYVSEEHIYDYDPYYAGYYNEELGIEDYEYGSSDDEYLYSNEDYLSSSED